MRRDESGGVEVNGSVGEGSRGIGVGERERVSEE